MKYYYKILDETFLCISDILILTTVKIILLYIEQRIFKKNELLNTFYAIKPILDYE